MGRFARIDSQKKKNLFLFSFANRPSRKWIAARIGRESREFECESERRRDSCESGQFFFLRIDSGKSAKHWCGNRLPTRLSTLPTCTSKRCECLILGTCGPVGGHWRAEKGRDTVSSSTGRDTVSFNWSCPKGLSRDLNEPKWAFSAHFGVANAEIQCGLLKESLKAFF